MIPGTVGTGTNILGTVSGLNLLGQVSGTKILWTDNPVSYQPLVQNGFLNTFLFSFGT